MCCRRSLFFFFLVYPKWLYCHPSPSTGKTSSRKHKRARGFFFFFFPPTLIDGFAPERKRKKLVDDKKPFSLTGRAAKEGYPKARQCGARRRRRQRHGDIFRPAGTYAPSPCHNRKASQSCCCVILCSFSVLLYIQKVKEFFAFLFLTVSEAQQQQKPRYQRLFVSFCLKT